MKKPIDLNQENDALKSLYRLQQNHMTLKLCALPLAIVPWLLLRTVEGVVLSSFVVICIAESVNNSICIMKAIDTFERIAAVWQSTKSLGIKD